jgi:hypothetical protein
MKKRGVAGGLIQKPTQRDEVLAYMRAYGKISTFDAYTELGVTQLGARIKELESRGLQIGRIKKVVVSRRTGKTIHFVEYYIKEADAV